MPCGSVHWPASVFYVSASYGSHHGDVLLLLTLGGGSRKLGLWNTCYDDTSVAEYPNKTLTWA